MFKYCQKRNYNEQQIISPLFITLTQVFKIFKTKILSVLFTLTAV